MVKKFEWYKADDEKTHTARRRPRPTKLRHNLTPGQVLVLLVGKFKGKRVVFLKQLDSGMLLVTGPYKVNGVPLRRIPQKYTLATSKHVAVDGVNVAGVTDAFFKKAKGPKGTKEQQFFSKDNKEAGAKVRYLIYINPVKPTFTIYTHIDLQILDLESRGCPREKGLTKTSRRINFKSS